MIINNRMAFARDNEFRFSVHTQTKCGTKLKRNELMHVSNRTQKCTGN